jgi:hypothetical protein
VSGPTSRRSSSAATNNSTAAINANYMNIRDSRQATPILQPNQSIVTEEDMTAYDELERALLAQ